MPCGALYQDTESTFHQPCPVLTLPPTHRTSLLHLIFLLCPEAMELKVNLLQLCGLLHTESNRGFL